MGPPKEETHVPGEFNEGEAPVHDGISARRPRRGTQSRWAAHTGSKVTRSRNGAPQTAGAADTPFLSSRRRNARNVRIAVRNWIRLANTVAEILIT